MPLYEPPTSLYKICTCVIRRLVYSFTSVEIKFDTLFNIIKQYPRRSQTIQDHLIPTFSQLTTTLYWVESTLVSKDSGIVKEES